MGISAVGVLAERLRRAGDLAAERNVEQLLITPGTDLRYLLGRGAGSHERLTCLLVPGTGHLAPPALLVPELEAPGWADVPLAELGVEVVTWRDGEDPYLLVSDLAGGPRQVGIADTMPAVHVLGVRDALPEAGQELAGAVLREMRMRKDPAEIDALRAAGQAIDRVHARMGDFLRAGRTESQVAAAVNEAILAEGHAEAAFVIIGSGPNAASPHHEYSDRVIQDGEIVVVDIGGPLPDGYCSDSTRCYAVGSEPPDAVRESYAVLQRAQQAAVDAVRPGRTAHEVDAAARDVLVAAGLGERFIHRTGHGIGLDVHEEPFIVAGNKLALEPGMAFSVEPGVYVDGQWGARIEDIVAVTEDGCERLNTRPRELTVL